MVRTSYTSDLIGLRESSLHRDLKSYYAYIHHGLIEQQVCGYKVDVLSGDRAYEIQTKDFYKIKPKILALLDGGYQTCVVHPMQGILEVRLPLGKTRKVRRKIQPLRAFEELVYVADILPRQGLSVELLSLHERRSDRKAKRNRVRQTHLAGVLARWTINRPEDLTSLLPADLPDEFTTRDLSEHAGIARWLAEKVAYTLRASGTATRIGSRNRCILYRLVRREPRQPTTG